MLLVVIILPLLPYNAAHIVSFASIPLSEVVIYSQMVQYTLDEVVIRANDQQYNLLNEISIGLIILTIYISGVLLRLLQFLFRLFQIRSLIRRSNTLKSDGLMFVFTEKDSPTYSFLNWIFIDPALFNNKDEFNGIISHEKIHTEQGHTYDLIIAEVLTIIQWFNPFAYMLKKTIKENHEYLTDKEVITNHHNAETYSLLLLNHSSVIKTNILTHNFSYSLLKRRLKMMKKSKHPLRFGLGILFITATLTVVFFACSSPEEKKTDTVEAVSTDADEVLTEVNNTDSVYKVVEVMPEFPGGIDALMKYLSENIKYPEDAKKEAIQGRVFVNFTVEKSGKVNNVNIIRGIGGGCDEEAIRVVSEMPGWAPGLQRDKPVRVSYNLPISFKLENPDHKLTRIHVIDDTDSVYQVVEVMPVYPGGIDALMKYLAENIIYPESAKKDGIQGRVFVNFTIEKNGNVNNVNIIRGIGGGCDEEAMRVISSMPDWEPGLENGKPVRVDYNIPIKFALD